MTKKIWVCRKTLEINSDSLQAYINLSKQLAETKRYVEAEEYYKKALKIDFNDAKIHYNYARLLREMGRYDEAEKHYRKALEIEPTFAR